MDTINEVESRYEPEEHSESERDTESKIDRYVARIFNMPGKLLNMLNKNEEDEDEDEDEEEDKSRNHDFTKDINDAVNKENEENVKYKENVKNTVTKTSDYSKYKGYVEMIRSMFPDLTYLSNSEFKSYLAEQIREVEDNIDMCDLKLDVFELKNIGNKHDSTYSREKNALLKSIKIAKATKDRMKRHKNIIDKYVTSHDYIMSIILTPLHDAIYDDMLFIHIHDIVAKFLNLDRTIVLTNTVHYKKHAYPEQELKEIGALLNNDYCKFIVTKMDKNKVTCAIEFTYQDIHKVDKLLSDVIHEY